MLNFDIISLLFTILNVLGIGVGIYILYLVIISIRIYIKKNS